MIAPVILSAVTLWASGGQPIEISPTADSWLGGHASIYVPGRIWVGATTLEAAGRGDPLALEVVLHEVGHTIGIANERQAGCFALRKLPGALRLFFGRSWRGAMVGYQRAASYVRGLPAKYSEGRCD